MEVTEKTIAALEESHLERLEADIVNELAKRLGISSAEALGRYYRSRLASQIAEGAHGAQYLSPGYLVDQLLSEERDGVPASGSPQRC